jgi:hypothetical protein
MSVLASVARMRGGAMRAFAKFTEHVMPVFARVLMSVDSPVRMPMILMSVGATVGCSTYAGGDTNAGFCQAHGACNACGCSCTDECGGGDYGFTCQTAHSVLIGKDEEGFSDDWKDDIPFQF